MPLHDYHLRGYEVLDFGSTLILHAVYDYPSQPKRETRLRFDDVELYNFTHTGGSILYDVEAIPVSDLLQREAPFIEASAKMFGVKGWRESLDQYQAYLVEKGAKAWDISSSVGFEGFVIARSVGEMRA